MGKTACVKWVIAFGAGALSAGCLMSAAPADASIGRVGPIAVVQSAAALAPQTVAPQTVAMRGRGRGAHRPMRAAVKHGRVTSTRSFLVSGGTAAPQAAVRTARPVSKTPLTFATGNGGGAGVHKSHHQIWTQHVRRFHGGSSGQRFGNVWRGQGLGLFGYRDADDAGRASTGGAPAVTDDGTDRSAVGCENSARPCQPPRAALQSRKRSAKHVGADKNHAPHGARVIYLSR